MAQIAVREKIAKLFERCYNSMTTDTGRNIALITYYAFKAMLIVISITYGITTLKTYLP